MNIRAKTSHKVCALLLLRRFVRGFITDRKEKQALNFVFLPYKFQRRA